ncbi:hypothetical protein pb186bvf_011293 [Paramecium bursaria]
MSKQSISTVFQLSNGMIGSAAIVLPVLYFEYGAANAAIISFIISIASCSTALILAKHHQPTEVLNHNIYQSDLSFTIQRILGQKWKILFSLSSMILLFACALINMILVCSLIYPIILLINEDFAIQVQFYHQILGRIYFLQIFLSMARCYIYTDQCLPSFLIKNIAPLLKLLSYGAVTIVLSVLFLIVKGSINISNIKWFSNDFTVLPGVFGLAFLCHLLLAPVLHNQNNQNKSRDIIISYGFTYLLYQIIGIFGSMAMNGQKSEGNGATILQYFPSNDWLVLALQILITLQLSLAFPVIQFVTRARFFELLYPQGMPKSRKQEIMFSIIFSLSCLVTQMLNANLAFVISFTGAIIGLFLVYLIPTMMEFKNNKIEINELLINESQELSYKRIPNYFLVLLNIIGISITVSRFI